MLRGEMFTVTPHALPHGPRCGTFHARIIGDAHDGIVAVQQMRIDGTAWRPGMSTCVYVTALRPLAVQVDLFGDPAPTEPRCARRRVAA